MIFPYMLTQSEQDQTRLSVCKALDGLADVAYQRADEGGYYLVVDGVAVGLVYKSSDEDGFERASSWIGFIVSDRRKAMVDFGFTRKEAAEGVLIYICSNGFLH